MSLEGIIPKLVESEALKEVIHEGISKERTIERAGTHALVPDDVQGIDAIFDALGVEPDTLVREVRAASVERSLVEQVKLPEELKLRATELGPASNNHETVQLGDGRDTGSQEHINSDRIGQIARNREDGANREEIAWGELQHQLPEKEGYKIEREQYLRDKDGQIVKDVESGQARRIDMIVIKGGEIVKSIEITSETAPKDIQMMKEQRIRLAGGEYVKSRDTGELLKVPRHVETEIRRYA